MSDTSKCHQHSVAYMKKMSSKWCRIHGSSRPRKPPVAIIHIFVRIFEVQLGGHGAQRSERLSDKTENHHPNKLYLNRSDDEKVRCFINKSLCLYSELWFLCRRGAHFYKKGEKRWPENENWVRKTRDGNFDAYKELPKTAIFRSVGENYYFLNSTRRKCPPQSEGFEAILGMETWPWTRR